jgi:hypothetical protein
MMFRGAYTDEFYHALHDALHAEVETWSRDNVAAPAELEVQTLWNRVITLEKTCRNQSPTVGPHNELMTAAAQFAD